VTQGGKLTVFMMLKGKFLTVTPGALAVLTVLPIPDALPAQSPAAEFREATYEVHGDTLHYLTSGSGPILLMLHGITLTGEQWAPSSRYFADSYTVVMADLPGQGGSPPFPETFSFVISAKLMCGLLDELGANPSRVAGSLTNALAAPALNRDRLIHGRNGRLGV
jgi:hypothetical protein